MTRICKKNDHRNCEGHDEYWIKKKKKKLLKSKGTRSREGGGRGKK